MTERPKNYDEILQQSIDETWGFIPVRCPHCGNGAVSYGNETRNGDRLYGVTTCSCDICGREWWEDDHEEE